MRGRMKWLGAMALAGVAGMANATVVVDMTMTAWTSELVDLKPSDGIAPSLTPGSEIYWLTSGIGVQPPDEDTQSVGEQCTDCAGTSATHAIGTTNVEGGNGSEFAFHIATTPQFETTPSYRSKLESTYWRFASFQLGAHSQVTFRTRLTVNAVVAFDSVDDDVESTTSLYFDPSCAADAWGSPGCGEMEFTIEGPGTLSEERYLSFVFTNNGDSAKDLVFNSLAYVQTEIRNVPIPQVPEPSTYAMLGVGLAGLWARSRRKNSQGRGLHQQ
ncbi:hypothetical protein GCM10007387_25490 [Pseudoduganella albidiflava]|nr:hypothetical protein GCM10007387_25490 [Pseudoduganella albidiflava]